MAVTSTVRIPKDSVVLPRQTYDRLSRDLMKARMEIRHLRQEEDALEIVAEGERAYREGKTIVARSSREAFRKYGRR